jgi:hypothetical protein
VSEKTFGRIDYVTAFEKYNTRFDRAFGPKMPGSYAKFGRTMIKRLLREEFDARLNTYVSLHAACKRMLDGGSTISDALVHEFEEAAAWVAVQAPDVYSMFKGEMGDMRDAAPIMPRD